MASPRQIESLERKHRENPEGLIFAPLANAYRNTGQPERALELLMEGLELHPDHAPARIVLGRCHLDLGNTAEAEAAFARVLELDPENVIALQALADITERGGRYHDAQRWLTTLLEVDRSNHDARDQLNRVEQAIAVAPDTVEPSGQFEDEADSYPVEAEAAVDQAVDEDQDESRWAAPGDEPAVQPEDDLPAAADIIDAAGDGPPEPEDFRRSAWEPPALADNAAEQAPMGWDQPLGDRRGSEERETESLWAPEGPVADESQAEQHLDEEPEPGTADRDFQNYEDMADSAGPTDVTADSADDFGITIEKEEDIVLHASDRSEFQTPDAAGQLRGDLDESREEQLPDEEDQPVESPWGAVSEVPSGFEATRIEDDDSVLEDEASRVEGFESRYEADAYDEPAAAEEEPPADAEAVGEKTEPDDWSSPPAWSWSDVDVPAGDNEAATGSDDAFDSATAPEAAEEVPATDEGGEQPWDGDWATPDAEQLPGDEIEVELSAPEAAAPMPPFEEDEPYGQAAAPWADDRGGEPEEPVEEDDTAAEPPDYQPAISESVQVDHDSEPEIIATETMAELYLSQGHRNEALEVYRLLAAQSPEDSRLKERIAALESDDEFAAPSRTAEEEPAEHQPLDGAATARSYSSAATGEPSARQLFSSLLAAAGAPADDGPEEPAAQPSESGEQASDTRGAPTRPAQDRLSLSAVFGEDASPVPPAVGSAGESGGEGFSFDSFFGEGKRPKPGSAGKGSEDDDLDQFNDWLQGLKG